MNIIGLDSLIFAVPDLQACRQYLLDYGLEQTGADRFEALDGTSVVLAASDDPSLPEAPGASCLLRKTIFGVADQASLQAIAEELGKDRDVRVLDDGSLQSVDDMGFAIGFQISVRKPLMLAGEVSNAPGSPLPRPLNSIAVDRSITRIQPRTLSHIVYFVADVAKAEAFYVERLGFRCTDRFTGVGPFLQPPGCLDHHTHFLIGAPAFMTGVEHFTFHFGGPTEVIQNGNNFIEKGYQAFWGPGRHVFGSNWFWYFNSPFACHVEMDADMDMLDLQWTAREAPISADNSQSFLLGYRKKWMPGPDSSANGDYEG